MSEIHISKHPLVLHKLTLLRSVETQAQLFRRLVRELAFLQCINALEQLKLEPCEVTTPMGIAKGHKLIEAVALVPVLRAGLGMVQGVLDIIPEAQVWHIGLYRDEKTLQPVEYYKKIPENPAVDLVLVLDPMLATGGSAAATIDLLKSKGAKRINYVGLLAAPEGIEHLTKTHPDVPIYVAAIDERLNEIGYIVPGLGDAGDRQFGT
jgi:uracil phosphoribosyltransferase